MRWRLMWPAMAMGAALMLTACGPDDPSSQDGALTSALPPSTVVSTTHCASLPVEQVHVLGTTYWRSFADPPSPEELGDVVGTITRALPPEAFTCGTFVLVDGQGSPPNGTNVYAIKGVPAESVVATFIDGQMSRYVNSALFGRNATR